MMKALSSVQVKSPLITEPIHIPMDWGWLPVGDGGWLRHVLGAGRRIPARAEGSERPPRRHSEGRSMSAILRSEGLTRVLPAGVPVTLVEDITLEIEQGEFVAIMGPSGSGNPPLLYLLGLLDMPTSGKIS